MISHTYKGKLISFEGPNGSGKSTLIEKVLDGLNNQNLFVYLTKEPTHSDLGDFIRKYSENHTGYELACLVAADRYNHLITEIIPKLEDGYIVLTDRYILSSLILQPIDNISTDYVLKINENIIAPDLQVSVHAEYNTIRSRLEKRNNLTRFEVENNLTLDEIHNHIIGEQLLLDNKINILTIDNNFNLLNNVKIVRDAILNLCGDSYE